MKKILLILSLALMSNYAVSHCGSCGTGDKHGEGENAKKGLMSVKAVLFVSLKMKNIDVKKRKKVKTTHILTNQ